MTEPTLEEAFDAMLEESERQAKAEEEETHPILWLIGQEARDNEGR